MQLLDRQRPAPQIKIPVKCRQIGTHTLDQAVIDLLWDSLAKECRRNGTVITPHTGCKDVLLDIGRKHRRQRIFVRLIGVIQSLKSGLTHLAVAAFHKAQVIAVGDLHQLAVFITHHREFDIRIVEHPKNRPGCRHYLARECQNLLFLLGADMRTHPQNLGKEPAVQCQLGLLQPALQLLITDRQKLGILKRKCRRYTHAQILRPIGQPLIYMIAVILITLHLRIEEQTIQLSQQALTPAQILRQPPGTLAQRPGKALCPGQKLLGLPVCLLPLVIIGKNRRYIPFQLLRHILAPGQGLDILLLFTHSLFPPNFLRLNPFVHFDSRPLLCR